MTSRFQLPPILKACERLLLEIEQAVRQFPRYHRYMIGSDLRRQMMSVNSTANRAWRDRSNQAKWVGELVWGIDDLKQHLQAAKLFQAFRSFRQFEMLIRLAEWEGVHVHGSTLRGRPAAFRDLRARLSSYQGHLRHANSHHLLASLYHRFPWLACAATPRRFSYRAERKTLSIPWRTAKEQIA